MSKIWKNKQKIVQVVTQDKIFTEEAGKKFYQAHLLNLEAYGEECGEDTLVSLGKALIERGR